MTVSAGAALKGRKEKVSLFCVLQQEDLPLVAQDHQQVAAAQQQEPAMPS
jgi:hypothetical protein